jgi:excisionase family DNA binding protein
MSETREILCVDEVAEDLRCSKAHVYNAINGKIQGVTKLPAICMGRRKLIRRSALEAWKRANEQNSFAALAAPVTSWTSQ